MLLSVLALSWSPYEWEAAAQSVGKSWSRRDENQKNIASVWASCLLEKTPESPDWGKETIYWNMPVHLHSYRSILASASLGLSVLLCEAGVLTAVRISGAWEPAGIPGAPWAVARMGLHHGWGEVCCSPIWGFTSTLHPAGVWWVSIERPAWWIGHCWMDRQTDEQTDGWTNDYRPHSLGSGT